MSADSIRVDFAGTCESGRRIETIFRAGSREHRVYFESDARPLTPNVEALLAGVLPVAMRRGWDLASCGQVSERLLLAVPKILDLCRTWDASVRKVEIRGAVPVAKTANPSGGVGVFFSGGVDSFYTLLRHESEITDLIFVHGFDIPLGETSLRNKTSEMVRRVSSELGKRTVEVETNLRQFLEPHVDWGREAHGAALAAVGHLLSPALRRIYIPASHVYDQLDPWGSHPHLDPLWSSEALEFFHDGCEASRLQKVAFVSGSDLVMQSLRVCWKNPNGVYNCGRCEKCLRTMISLHVAGALNRCATFDTPLDVKRVSRIRFLPENTRAFVRENLDALGHTPLDEALRAALQRVLSRPAWPMKAVDRAECALKRHTHLYLVVQGAGDWLTRLLRRRKSHIQP